eukprot:6856026-Heterocapsa_arctica.AAC.1
MARRRAVLDVPTSDEVDEELWRTRRCAAAGSWRRRREDATRIEELREKMFKDALYRVDEDAPEAGDGQRAAAEEAAVPIPQLCLAAAMKRGSEQEDT